MATAVKRKLSGSTDGKMIKVVATATTGTTIHTAVSGTTAGTFDEVWIYAQNNHTIPVNLTIEFGGTASPDDLIQVSITNGAGLYLIVPGLILQNSKVITAFASVANMVSISGWVNSMTD